MVTLRPEPGAVVSMAAQFNPASFITLDGLTLTGLDVSGKTHDISVLNSRFTGQADLNMTGNANANILIDGSSFDNISVCAQCAEGRLSVRQYPMGSQPVGVTISNNHFGGPGESDGVQNGAYGVVITGNEFDGIVQGNYGRHVDSIQLYGQSHTTITNNYLHNFSTAIMAPDGGDHEVINNNVFIAPSGPSSAIQFGHHDGTTFIHNTVKNTDVHTWVGSGDSDPNRNVVLRDNVMINAGFVASGCVSCTNSYNMFTTRASGTNAITATPTFVGGVNPTTYAGWALAPGSPGKGNASDANDRGINPNAVGAAISAAGSPTGTAVAPAVAGTSPPATPGVRSPKASALVRARWTFRPRRPLQRTRILLIAPLTKAGGRRCTWSVAPGITRRGCTIAVRFKTPGLKDISLRIVDRSGAVLRGSRDIRVAVRRG